MTERAQRRLAAIVSTDVVGYSRLIGADEAGTLARMKAHRQELWTPEIDKHGGRIVGTAGDSLLVEFASAVSAVECSLAVQQGMAEREAGQSDESRMLLRIGVNIGEVVVDGDDIYGDGVNVAARLQAIAPEGGICLSGKVHDEVDGKIAAAFADAGEQEVKNIARPVQVWRWPADGAEVTAPDDMPSVPSDKPSIAVLAFNNMSGDPEQEYFSDGISEDIITALSKFRNFHVIARNSSFTYKGQAVDIKKVGRELGVRYVLEGSVRKSGNRVRITAQLIEAETGNHIWADRYDRELEDVFAVQDEITNTIAGAISPAFEQAELRRVSRQRPENLDAWDLTLRANQLAARLTPEDLAQALDLAKRAVALDRHNAQAWAILAWCYGWQAALRFAPREEATKEGMKAARQALEIDPNDAVALRSMSGHLWLAGQREEGLETMRQCVAENPNYAQGWMYYGISLASCRRYEEGVQAIERGALLSPRDPGLGMSFANLAFMAFVAGRPEEGLAYARRARKIVPGFLGAHRACAALHAALGEMEEAADSVAEMLSIKPDTTVKDARDFWHANVVRDADRDYVAWITEAAERYCDCLRKAGVPE